MTITLYGIPNCDTVKKARTWLEQQGIAFEFHDFKKAGVSPALIDGWLQQLDWEQVLNRKGTTWRKLDEAQRAQVVDAASAKALLLENPSAIKRPVLDLGTGFDQRNSKSEANCAAKPAVGSAAEKHVQAQALPRFYLGFNEAQYQALFASLPDALPPTSSQS